MWIRRLKVTDCSGIANADIDFEPGLNVLHGPNELGKSSLVAAVRAALLLQSTSTEAKALKDWNGVEVPTVTLVLQQEPGRIWQIRKAFAFGRRGHAYLDFSRDGQDFHAEHGGKDVDGTLQEMLGWGIKPPGGIGGKKKASSLITTALLGEQSDVVAILNQSLANDPTASGRERLTSALQALAEDPRFKQVVNAAQAKVDEAFTPGGKPRAGQGSPWTDLKRRRKEAEEQLQAILQQLDESHGATQRVEQLSERLRNARDEQERLTEALKLRRQREAAEQAHSAAQAAFEHVERVAGQLADNELAVEQATVAVAQLDADRAQLEAASNELATQAEAARERVRELESGGGEQQRKIREQDAEKRQLALKAQRRENLDRYAEALEGLNVVKKLKELQEGLNELESTTAEKVGQLEDARDENDEDLADIQELELKRDVARYLADCSAAERVVRERDDARSLAENATEHERRGAEMRHEAAALNAPDEAEIERLRQAEREWQLAEAKLSVGFVAEFTLTSASEAQAEVDGEPQTLRLDADKAETVEAERELTLTIPDVATFHVRGGDADLRSQADEAKRRWREASSPVFGRAGCESLAALIEIKSRADAMLTEADNLTREARSAAQRAEGLDTLEQRVATAQAAAQRQRDAIEEVLDGEETIEEFADEIAADEDHATWDEAAWNAEIARRSKDLQERERLCERLQTEIEADVRENTRLRQELAASENKLGKGSKVERDWRRTLGKESLERTRLDEQLAAVDAELEAIRTEATTEVGAARAAHKEAEARLGSATQELNDKTEARDAVGAELHDLQVAAGALRANAEGQDLEAAKMAVEAATQALAELPATEDPTDVDEAERQAQRTKQLVDELESDRDRAEGALEQMGGQVLDEQREQVEETVKALDSRERELELDYEAWRLLRDTLTEADEANAAHLGNALVEPVSRRMGALTGGRYGDIAIGPQLNASGIALAGGDRPFTSLSVGTQEQIALLLRLAIAEALGTFLILDDQLTQSDTTRMHAMHDVLAEAAERIQVVIFTCHPSSYPLDAANVVDLTQHIKRSDPAPASPSTQPPSPTPTASKAPTDPPPRTRRRRQHTPDNPGPTDTAAALKDSMESD